MARFRRLGDDFLDGCGLDFEAAAVSDAEAFALDAAADDEGDPVGFSLTSRVASAGRDLKIANKCRVAGLKTVEIAGWRSRGDAVLNPRGGVAHHTAGAKTGVAPSLAICVNGRSDLPGPLCQLFQDRNDRFHVVASGRANHAGSGGWRGLSGNSTVWGIEVEHPGTFPLDKTRLANTARAMAALLFGTAAAGMVAQHHEWSTAGKIDIGTPKVNGDTFRQMVARELRLLEAVEVSRIVYPTGQRKRNGDWIRKTVKLATSRVDEWIDNHPGALQRRGPGSGLLIEPSRL